MQAFFDRIAATLTDDGVALIHSIGSMGPPGPTNPFTLLYLVHITLSATILTKRWTWLLGALSVVCFGLLFLGYKPIPALEMHHASGAVGLHLIGMWVSFGVASLLVAMFSGKISELLRQHEESMLRMQEELAKKDRLASLVTLAAGSVQELGQFNAAGMAQ